MKFFREDVNVRRGRLKNGLTYYIRHNATPRGMACFYLVKRIGAVMEDDSQQGYAHFLEHMSFDGMDGFPASGIIRSMESIGVRFGEELNAYTNAEETVYTLKNVPVSSDNTDLALSAIKGWITGLHLLPDAVESEKGIVLDEFRVTASPMQRMFDRMQKGIFSGSRYGDRLVLGTEQSVSSLTSDTLRSFYEQWSRPDLSAIIAVGDFDAEDMERRIQSMRFPSFIKLPERPIFPIPDNIEPIILEEHDPEQELPRAALWIKRDVQDSSYINSHEALLEDYIMEIVVRMLGSRLQYIANGNDAPFLESQVSLSDFLLSSTKRMMEVIVDMQPGNFAAGLHSCLVELRRAAQFGFSEAELAKAKRGWMNSMETNYNERDTRSSESFCNEYLRNYTRLEPIPSIEDEREFSLVAIPKVSLDDVNAAASQILSGRGVVIGGFLPQDCRPDMSAIVAEASRETLHPFTGLCHEKDLIDPLPNSGTIVKEEDAQYGYRRFVLGNGANVYLKTTDFSDDEVLLRCIRSKGRKNYHYPLESFALEYIIEIGGFGPYSRQDICSMIDDRQVEIRSQTGALMFSLDCGSNRRDAETMLQMVYLYFTSRRKDDAAFLTWKQRMRSMLRAGQFNPSEDIFRLSDNMLFNDSENYVKIEPEKIDEIDYSTACSIADDLFSDASAFSFIFTGNITADELRPLILQYIAPLPSTGNSEKQTLSHLLCPGYDTSLQKRKLETPAAYSLTAFAGYFEPGIRNDILAEMLGQLIEMELLEKVREKDGEVYSIYSYGYLSSYLPVVAFLNVYFQSEIGREEIIQSKVDEVLKNGPSEDKLASCKEYMLKKYRNDLRNNKFYQKKMVSLLISGQDTLTEYEKTLASISISEVRSFLQSMGSRKRVMILPQP